MNLGAGVVGAGPSAKEAFSDWIGRYCLGAKWPDPANCLLAEGWAGVVVDEVRAMYLTVRGGEGEGQTSDFGRSILGCIEADVLRVHGYVAVFFEIYKIDTLLLTAKFNMFSF